MYRALLRSQALLAVASVAYLLVATLSMAQVQTSALAVETEALDLETGMERELSPAGLSTEAWRAVTRYIEQDQYGVQSTAEIEPGERVFEDAKLLASDGPYRHNFGGSVAVFGDTVVVGAHSDDDQGLFSGSAYVFEKPVGGWSGTLTEAAKLLASDGAEQDYFGYSVAVSGDTVVVGARYDDDQGSQSGSAYVFEKPAGGWSGTLTEAAKLLASDGAGNDQFGGSVAVFGDTVVVGAHQADRQVSDSGSAYVFEKPVGGWSGTLNEAAKLLASDGGWSRDAFGRSVALSGDTVVAGAIYDHDQGLFSGSAYVFEKPVGGWSGTLNEAAKLLASDGAGDDTFGYSVAVSGDRVVVGAYLDDDQGEFSGSAYIFGKPVGGWSGTLYEAVKLLASDGATYHFFGRSVAVSGGTVGVGAEVRGSAYVFGPADSDGDGVPDELDVCADTVIPEGVPTRRLGRNRFALVDDDGVFDTNRPRGRGPGVSFTIEETGGCSCEQIIDALGLGKGHVKFGCSIGAMETWAGLVNP